jgi:UDP-N-acetylmuramoyl-tripeptide--D-alanyl-D-alanine ligase
MKLSLGKIAEYIGANGAFDSAAVAQGYSIDSRTITAGQLFFAIKGENLDGHNYVQSALSRGAVAAVVEKSRAAHFPPSAPLLVVPDTLGALQELAVAIRRDWGKPVIAITGSVGKTTTKEIAARLLATRFNVLKAEGNFNNHFGLPLQLLKLEPEHDLAVMELGMSHAGEIAALAEIARPNVGVVTCVAPVHLEFFDSIGSIARAKQELITALPPDGTAVLNADDEFVARFGANFAGRVVMFGTKGPADVRAECMESRTGSGTTFDIVAGDKRVRAGLPLVGAHNVHNALAAVAVALQFGIGVEEAATTLGTLEAVDKRGQILGLAGATVVNDCYNSNPKALDAMVDALAAMTPGRGGRRIVVAGEMLELGATTDDLHRRCGMHMAARGIDVLLGVRGAAKRFVEAANPKVKAEFVETPEQAGEWLAREVRPGDVVLLKASRGVKLERALDRWKAKLASAESVSGT